jgi:hypothetical protein
MNYLTQYYKNICEDLQAKIEIIEANIRSASEIQQLGSEEYQKALDKKKMELGRDLTMDEISDVGQTTVVPYTIRALKREALIGKATEQLPSVAQTGDVETATQYADVMGDISKKNISGKFAGFANLGSDSARTLQHSVENIAQMGRDMRKRGMQTSVPADIASMRKFIEMGKGKYEAPYPQPTDSTPNFFDGPDMDKKGSASEVVAAQRRNQYKGSIKESILPQKPKPIRLPPSPGTFDRPGDILTRTDEFGRKIEVTENDPLDVVLGSLKDKKEKLQKFEQNSLELPKGDFEKYLDKMRGKTTKNKFQPGTRKCDPFPCPEDVNQTYTPGTQFPHTGSSQY